MDLRSIVTKPQSNTDVGIRAVAQAMETVVARIDFSLVSRSAAHNIESLLNTTILQGGKRFRPTMLVLFARFLGLDSEPLLPYARAAELAHAATLAHDDVIDEAKERRNARTLNVVASNAHAVLGGDFLLARVIAEIASLGELTVIQDMAEVLEQLVAGEWMQLEARGRIDVDAAHLERVAERKTASLIAWCCTTPARLAKLSPETLDLCRRFGIGIGVAFQQMDDLLDFEQGTGKEAGRDFREGLINFVACEHLRRFPMRRAEIARSLGRQGEWPYRLEELRVARESVRAIATARVFDSRTLLNRIVEQASAEGIAIDQGAHAGLLQLLDGIIARNH